MKYSIEQSEITERTEQINKFALLVDLFNNKAVDRETFMAELSKIEQTDWAKKICLISWVLCSWRCLWNSEKPRIGFQKGILYQ